MKEKLNYIRTLCKSHKYKEADKLIDAIYESYISDEIQLNNDEVEYMYLLIDWISSSLSFN